jgi:hypothetical protein
VPIGYDRVEVSVPQHRKRRGRIGGTDSFVACGAQPPRHARSVIRAAVDDEKSCHRVASGPATRHVKWSIIAARLRICFMAVTFPPMAAGAAY